VRLNSEWRFSSLEITITITIDQHLVKELLPDVKCSGLNTDYSTSESLKTLHVMSLTRDRLRETE